MPIFFFFCRVNCHYINILNCIHKFFVFTGSYFARDARYSSKFCHSTSKHNFILQRHGMAPAIFQSDPPYKCMFLARVLVGEYTLGHPQYCRPPSKDTSIANFFDSCVDDLINPKIFVIFDSNQIYPEYLIEFYWCQRPKESQHKLCKRNVPYRGVVGVLEQSSVTVLRTVTAKVPLVKNYEIYNNVLWLEGWGKKITYIWVIYLLFKWIISTWCFS